MVWKAKHKYEQLKDGQVRELRCFAWIPKEISGDIVWLQNYIIYQVYRVKDEIASAEILNEGIKTGEWKIVKFVVGNWIDLSVKII